MKKGDQEWTDKAIIAIEQALLPAPEFIVTDSHFKVVIYGPRSLSEMDKQGKTRACYQHCCLKYLNSEKMTNETLRSRLAIEKKNAAVASRIISDTVKDGLIRASDPSSSTRKYKSYVPFWA